MDTNSLGFRCEENFSSSFTSSDYFNIEEESQGIVNALYNGIDWKWEGAQEIIGDIPLIPTSNNTDMGFLSSNASPADEDYQSVMKDWQYLVGNDQLPDIDEFASDNSLSLNESDIVYLTDTAPIDCPSVAPASTSSPTHVGFPVEPSPPNSQLKLARSTGKKIDMSAQCYIVQEDKASSDDNTDQSYSDMSSSSDDEDSSSSSDSGSSCSDAESSSSDDEDDVQIKCESIDIEEHEVYPNVKLEPAEHTATIDFRNSYTDSDSDYVDIDTISNHSTPILQAGDLNSLLEQFEASESTQFLEPTLEPLKFEEIFENIPVTLPPALTLIPEIPLTHVIVPEMPAAPVIMPETPTASVVMPETPAVPVVIPETLVAPVVMPKAPAAPVVLSEPPTASAIVSEMPAAPVIETLQTPEVKTPTVNTTTTNEEQCDKNKQILNALPQELIMRIKASSKRKMIPVIDPIPAKRRGIKRTPVETVQAPTPPPQENKVEKCPITESVQLDHDYCGLATPYPKHPQKDSGFESAEEDEQRNILRNQPTVKGADGKLMVSLLKVNTIRNSIATDCNDKKKKKLNLEEYKKRRVGTVRSNNNSQSNSPTYSNCNSPTVVEDENERLLKHRQKLMQMAEEVLKTPAKSATKASPNSAPAEIFIPLVTPQEFSAPVPPPIPPENVEVKVLVSMGVNTDSNNHMASKQFNVPVTELDEIKPLLQNANAKINTNSLITSVIENIQNKKKAKDIPTECIQNTTEQQIKDQQHGEDKTIVYLYKNRPPVVTNSIEVQTDLTIPIKCRREKRRRTSSTSSDDHRNTKHRSSSSESNCSYTSQSSSSSASRSRSRSPTPRKIYNRKRSSDNDRERIREVEERRIVYVGGISKGTKQEALRRRFEQYGPISNISVHFREYGDNYGFVTFVYKVDAYDAVEHGNDDPTLPRYDLSFGGRRIFCRTHYADLDNVHDEMEYGAGQAADSFDNLLREAQAKLRKRKSCT